MSLPETDSGERYRTDMDSIRRKEDGREGRTLDVRFRRIMKSYRSIIDLLYNIEITG